MKSKSKTKPIYSGQIEGAASTLTGAYNQAAPGIQKNADAISALVPSLIDRYKTGDPNVVAARGYDADVLRGKYLNNSPHLQAMIDQTGDDVRNGWQASLGTRGLTGGSAAADIISRNLAKNSTNLRYQDYGAERDRMEAAAGRAPSYTAADAALLDQAMGAANASLVPLQAASGYAGGIGGLLGQYVKQSQSGSIGGLLGGLAGSALSGWASGGFK